MNKRTFLAKSAGLLLVLAFMAGCTAPMAATTAAQPTADLDAVRTEAAGTVVAKITYAAALNPSSTPAPTNTTVPTVVPPTATQVAAVMVNTSAPSVTPTKNVVSGGSVWVPTKTPYTDAATLISQSPKDGKSFSQGADFDIIWTLKNTGFRDWNSSFYLRYLKGVEGSDSKSYLLPVLKQTEEGSVRVDMVAPSEPGSYSTTWQLINDDGTAFYTVNLVFSVQ